MFGQLMKMVVQKGIKKIGMKLGQKASGFGARLGMKAVKGQLKKLGQKHVSQLKEKAIEGAKSYAKKKAEEMGKKVIAKGIERIKKGSKSKTMKGLEDYTAKKGLIHDVGGHLKRQMPLDYQAQFGNIRTAKEMARHIPQLKTRIKYGKFS